MAGFFTCQQFQPEYFWKADYQHHENTASAISEVCLVAQNPDSVAPFMTAFTDCDTAVCQGENVIIATSRGRLAILTPSSFEKRYQTTAPDMANGPQLAGFTIAVAAQPPRPVSVCNTAILFEPTS